MIGRWERTENRGFPRPRFCYFLCYLMAIFAEAAAPFTAAPRTDELDHLARKPVRIGYFSLLLVLLLPCSRRQCVCIRSPRSGRP